MTDESNSSSEQQPLSNVAILARVIPFLATSVKRTIHLSFLNSIWSDCIANYSKSSWERLFQKEPNTAERLAMRSCNLGLFEIARVVAGNSSAASLRDSSGWSTMHQASFSGRPSTCSLMLQMDETEVNAQTNTGWTPVRCAIYNDDTSVMRVLCESERVDIFKPCQDGDSPLMACVTAGLTSRLKMMEVLLESCQRTRGEEKCKELVNYTNPKSGLSALFLALRNRDGPAVELLIKYGADVEQRDPKFKRTAALFIVGAPDVVSVPMMTLLLEKYRAEICPDSVRDMKGNSVFKLVKGEKIKNLLEVEAGKRGIKDPWCR